MISILYIDDETDLLVLCKIFLERTGEFRVDTTTSVQNAWELLKDGSYDAIISDYQMPETNGIEFLEQVRSSLGDIPFILFTGKGREEVVIRAIDSGVDFYQQKGGDPKAQFAELTHKVKKAVERSRAVHALEKSEERMRLAFEGANEGLWDINIATGEVYLSPRGCEMLGYSSDDIKNFSHGRWREIVHPDDLLQTLTRLDHNRKKEIEFFESEERILTRSGEWKWVLTRGKIFERDEEGHAVRFVGTHTDITGQKMAQEELLAAYEQIAASEEELRVQFEELSSLKDTLQESEARYRLLADNVQDVIWTTNEKMAFTYVSPSIQSLFGVTQKEALEKPFSTFVTPESYQELITHVSRWKDAIMAGHKITDKIIMELEFLGRDESTIWTEITISMVYDNENRFNGIAGVTRDINQKKKAETAIRRANRQLSLLSGITRHDILNKISILKGVLSIMKPESIHPEQIEFYQMMDDSVQHIHNQINFAWVYEKLGVREPQ
ncbi:MAG: PAS domain S-box protein [Methanospirillum sp.]|nr:PAS domain S-box protein [Methanospirillum sp.]